MKRKAIAVILAAGMVFSMAACGTSTSGSADSTGSTVSAEETSTIGTSFVDERSGKEDYDTFDEVIGYLQENEGYSYISVAGHDGYVLAITNTTYAWDEKTNASTDVYLYGHVGYVGNKVINIGHISTGGTANPVRCSDDGILYNCNNKSYGEMKFDDADAIFFTKKIDIAFDDSGKATLSGYTSEDGNPDNESKDIGISTEEEFSALFEGIEEISPINFKLIEHASYDEVISQLPAEGGYAYVKLDGYDGDILAASDMVYDWDNGVKASCNVYFYAMVNDKAVLIGDAITGGTANPVKCSEDGTLYVCNNHQYNEVKVHQDKDGNYRLYYAKSAGDENAEGSFSGFISADAAAETVTLDELQTLFDAIGNVAPINFKSANA